MSATPFQNQLRDKVIRRKDQSAFVSKIKKWTRSVFQNCMTVTASSSSELRDVCCEVDVSLIKTYDFPVLYNDTTHERRSTCTYSVRNHFRSRFTDYTILTATIKSGSVKCHSVGLKHRRTDWVTRIAFTASGRSRTITHVYVCWFSNWNTASGATSSSRRGLVRVDFVPGFNSNVCNYVCPLLFLLSQRPLAFLPRARLFSVPVGWLSVIRRVIQFLNVFSNFHVGLLTTSWASSRRKRAPVAC